MILRPAQIHLMRLGRPVTPANFGGDSESDSSTNTTNQTNNYVKNTDKRAVAGDSAVAISGNGNVIDKSVTNNQTDMSSWLDMSNKSTNFQDNSDRSTHIVATDFGAVSSAMDLAKLTVSNNQQSVMGAFDLVKGANASSLTNSAQVLGFATNVIKTSEAAFAEAKDKGESKMVLAALGAVALVGVAFAMRN